MPIETTYERLLQTLTDQADEAGALSDEAGEVTRAAFLQARIDIQDRMEDLIVSRGGLENLSARDRFRLTRDTALIENVERRLGELGVEHQSIVGKYFGEAGQLASGHVGVELQAVADQIQHVKGDMAFAAAIDSARLDTAAIEMGLGTAVRDTRALNDALQVTVTRELQAGVTAGEGIPALTRRLEVIPEISASRGEVISRWATIKGYNLARQAQYEASAATIPGLMKQWLCATDERTCPHCLAHHGEIAAVAGEFDSSRTFSASPPPTPYLSELEVPPLHPRCRCTIVSWTEEWRAFTDATPAELEASAKELAAAQGFPGAAVATGAPVQAVKVSGTHIADEVQAALGGAFRAYTSTDDFAGTVAFDGSIDDARLALRNAGFRVRVVEGADDLLRVDLPEGITLPRMLRSTRLRRLPEEEWLRIKEGLLRCATRLR